MQAPVQPGGGALTADKPDKPTPATPPADADPHLAAILAAWATIPPTMRANLAALAADFARLGARLGHPEAGPAGRER